MSIPSTPDAYHRIRRWIVEGRLRPGARLIEQRLAEDLDLSRTPVREALRMLQSEGLVTFEPNRGARVRELTRAHIADLYELRARLESMAAELAAVRATAEERRDLVAADQAFAAAVEAVPAASAGLVGSGGSATSAAPASDDLEAEPDPVLEAVREVFHQNDVFHLTLLAAAHHEPLMQTLIRSVDHTLVFQAFRHYDRHGMECSVEFHGLITAAIVNGEGERAARLMHEHVLQGRDQLFAVVGQDDSVDALFDEPPLQP
ncbi:MAG: GntR family transcriptional regulator [Acidimicrobiales bacterium]|nr:GntR family transcriptional regulator [Acidimicrobiales bacterium]